MSKRNVFELLIGILALISIILVAVETLVSVSPGTLIGIYITDLVICIVFAVDFIIRARVSENKKRFFKTSGFEILAMIPAISLYALGTIPAIAVALRSLRLFRLIRVVLLLARMKRVFSKSGSFLKRSNLLTLLLITISVVFIGAFAALVFDRDVEGAKISSLSDAIWWSISTITTVGYGDIVPHSIAGRIMGMFLMAVGIGVMATFTSQVSATLVESRLKQKAEKDDYKTALISEIKNRIDNIENLSENDVSLLIQTIHTLRLEHNRKQETES